MARELPIPSDLFEQLTKQLPKGVIVKAVDDAMKLTAKCHGDEKVRYVLADVRVVGAPTNHKLESKNVVFFENETLGNHVQVVPEAVRYDHVAEMLIDSGCAVATCNNGQNCALKRIPQGKR